MRVETLLSPGSLSNGYHLRREVCKAISGVEITARHTPGGKTKAAARLQAFFTDAASKLAAIADLVLPVVTTRVRTATNTAVVTFAEALDPTVTPALSTFVFTPPRTVTAVVVSGSTVTITATGTVAGDSVAYTAPATGGLRDRAGNLAASFTGVLA